MDILLRILTLLGSLGIFLYGMKLMSEALQKLAGTRMRKILLAITSTRIKGLLSGLLITSTVQSSSAVTVLVVSFVNAGLISLTASIAVIFGANIGTTVTAWLISLLGFTFSISQFSLPLIGLCFPLILSRKRKLRSWGEFVLGLALLFLGLEYIKSILPELEENPEAFSFLLELTAGGFWAILLFVCGGIFIAAILQSSTASMALILAMAYKGLISFDLAAAMVIGMNIGTTVTANLAAVVANYAAKRTARVHFLFNLIGAIMALLLFRPFLLMIDWIFQWSSGITFFGPTPMLSEEVIQTLPLALALFHTLFNVFTSLILFPFMGSLISLSKYLTLHSKSLQEYRLKYLNRGLMSTPELSTLEARKQIASFGRLTSTIFNQVSRQFMEMDEKKYAKWRQKVQDSEESIDKMRLDMLNYLTALSSNELSSGGSRMVSSMQRIIEHLESIGDVCLELSHTIDAKVNKKIWFNQEHRDKLKAVFLAVESAISIMNHNLELDYVEVDSRNAFEAEEVIDTWRNLLHKEQREEMGNSSFRPEAANAFRDMLHLAEQIGDHIAGVTQAIIDTQVRTRSGHKRRLNN